MEDKIIKDFPQRIAGYEQRIAGYTSDIATVAACIVPEGEFAAIEINGITYTDKKTAGVELLAVCKSMTTLAAVSVGHYRGLELKISFDSINRQFEATLQGKLQHTVALGTDIFGNIQRIDNLLNKLPEGLADCQEQLENIKIQLANAKVEVEKPFAQEDELKQKSARLDELTILLNMDKQENEILDDDVGEDEELCERARDDFER